jgi:hypothetical protein
MVVGVVLFVVGISLRLGVLQVAGTEPPGPTTTADPVIVAASAPPDPTESARPVSPPSTLGQSPSPEPVATPDGGELLFADDFGTEAAWPVGRLDDWTTARYAAGWYVLEADPVDLPVYVAPVSSDIAAGSTIDAVATLVLDGPDGRAGVFVVDAAGARLVVLVSSDGRVVLVRDSMDQLDVIEAGAIPAADGPLRVALTAGPRGSVVTVDGSTVATFDDGLVPIGFGLAVWAQPSPAVVRADRFEVRQRSSL